MFIRTSALALMAAGFQCAPDPIVVQRLESQFDETVVERETNGEWELRRWENMARGTWTVTATDEGGMTCFMAAGTFLEA